MLYTIVEILLCIYDSDKHTRTLVDYSWIVNTLWVGRLDHTQHFCCPRECGICHPQVHTVSRNLTIISFLPTSPSSPLSLLRVSHFVKPPKQKIKHLTSNVPQASVLCPGGKPAMSVHGDGRENTDLTLVRWSIPGTPAVGFAPRLAVTTRVGGYRS